MNIYPQGLLTITGGIAGSLCFMFFSKIIANHTHYISKFLQWIGRNTLAIFCLHLLEDNIIRYDLVLSNIQNILGNVSWAYVLIFRLLVIAALCGIFYLIPKLNAVYFPSKRKKLPKKQRSVSLRPTQTTQ